MGDRRRLVASAAGIHIRSARPRPQSAGVPSLVPTRSDTIIVTLHPASRAADVEHYASSLLEDGTQHTAGNAHTRLLQATTCTPSGQTSLTAANLATMGQRGSGR